MMIKNPKISIICVTYNQEKYIQQTLDSFAIQETSFPYEIIIADDCSSDGTRKIIDEFIKKHPKLVIRPIFQEKNVGVLGNFLAAFREARGEYIALCEGDDYWTHANKLQIQADFLDNNPGYSVCFHSVRVVFENKEELDSIYPSKDESTDFSLSRLLQTNFIQTNSVMYRRLSYEYTPTNILPVDWYFHLLHAKYGKIEFIDKEMSVYRRHSGGVWWDSYSNASLLWQKHGVAHLGLFVEIWNLYKGVNKYSDVIQPMIVDMFNRLLDVDMRSKTNLVSQASAMYPDAAKFFIEKQNESIQRIDTIKNEKEAAAYRLSIDLSRAMEEIQQVKTSKSFLLGYYISHPWNAPRFILERVKINTYKMKVFLKNRRDLIESEGGYREMRARLASYRNKDQKKIAVVLHLYYPDLWGYFSEKLALLDKPAFDLFVSLPVGKEEFEQEIKKTYPDACVVVAPNRGRDVLPFLIIAKSLRKKGYDSVLKMHSKKSKHRKDGSTWLSSIVDNLLPENPGVVRSVIETLNESETGFIGPEGEYVSLPVNYEANKTNIRRLLKELKSSRIKEKVDLYRFDYGFFAGTMFWVRLDAIESILAKNASAALFDTEAGQIDNTYAHAVERMLCLIPELDDKKIYSVSAHGVRQIEYSSGLIPEWSDVYVGQASQKK